MDNSLEFFVKNPEQKYLPFQLSDDFLYQYVNVTPPWGPLGEFTYYRTYSRWIEDKNGNRLRKERWVDTIRRVVEGEFNIQKDFCHRNKIPWNNDKAA